MLDSVTVGGTKLKGIKVDSCKLGWRYTGDNLRTQVAGYYNISDKDVKSNTDLTISVIDSKRRVYGVEGAIDYFIPDTQWSTGANLNFLKTENKTDGQRGKSDVKTSSPA
ncbi:TonB-dependent receptor [Citrobacter sp. JGM124]|nr:TonB-dependent receptor [Citrobacter sp. JGM124]